MDRRKNAAFKVMKKLELSGYQAYLVGGCVRDECLGRVPQDYDVTTNAKPENVMEIFEKVIPTGLRHGTVTVLEQGIPVEVTTFRKEENYHNHRQPEKVEFVQSLKEDLARRDFTMNAMAKDLHGHLIDYFGGQKDLQNGRIRTVGNPVERFQEDALRMLRAIRFANQFQFRLDPATKQGIFWHKELGVYLSVERVTAELNKMFQAERVCQGLKLLFDTELIYFLPPFHQWNLPKTKVEEIHPEMDQINNRVVKWAYLLYLCGTPKEQLSVRLNQLKLPKKEKKEVSTCFVLAHQWMDFSPFMTEEDWRRSLLCAGLKAALNAEALAKVIAPQNRIPASSKLTTWWHRMKIHHPGQLNVNGRELLEACGRAKGPWIKSTLQVLFEEVALGHLPNEREILLKEGCKVGAHDTK